MNKINMIELNSKKFDNYKSENLVLLVGTNPLPNYVAYHLLANPSSHIFFVCTRTTDKIANNLINVLKIPDRCTKIYVEESDSKDIYSKINENLRGKQKIGLNYTGGTKAMAVHAYRAVEDANQDSIFSYLDARSLKLIVDKKDCLSNGIPVNTTVKPTMKELFNLHGYVLKNQIEEPYMPEICKILGKNLFEDLREWCDEKLRTTPSKEMLNNSKLKNVYLPTYSRFEVLVDFWEGCSTIGELAVKWKINVKKLAEWFDGKWLESYTLLSFQEVANECNIHDFILEAEFKDKFELDVGVLKGHELFVTSCTTERKKGIVKQKLFEAYIRGRQLGGDEAKIGLVCFASEKNSWGNPERIENEIKEEWHLEDKFRVFGAEQIPDLSRYLKEWVNSSNS